MTDQGNVSTSDTPQPRNEISVVTEENAATLAPESAPAAPTEKSGEPNTSDSAPPKSEPNADKQPRRRNRSAERKISTLTRKLEAAESAGTEQSTRISALETQIADLQKGATAPPKPRLKDFKSEGEFAEAYATWKADTAEPPKPPSKPAPKQPAADPPAGAHPQAAEIKALETAGEKLYGDEFEEVLHDDSLPLSVAIADFIFDSDKGPEMIMWLDEHREEGRELFRMRPTKQVKELEKIEAGLEKETAPPSSDAAPKKGADKPAANKGDPPAKPPGEPVKGDGPDAAAQGVVNGLSMDDYASRRRNQERSNHRP